ncbi:DUF4199 domain-containing protein [Croceimicrobium hydrocarbonivorans]|uniref:DUF4199 domain-containing protein n=1 Tax=Croceimicrobium hydrocarbonivorans TaxID=2761580 RepID=A0A7H0VF59_9FLAO|nr:DUF4199 domain-containing protein [Croceimicrobium hydrocarbonivorans]QNR24357.1 DUF4199 domain-containing protein [Croceimicrobium hydrocarbonivorans]
MRKIIWPFGLLSGLIIGSGFFINVGNSDLNSGSSEILRYLFMILVFGLILFFAVRLLQQKVFLGEINFSRAFIGGFYIVLIASVVYALMWELYFANHGHEYVSAYLAKMKERLDASSLGQLEIESRYTNQKQIMQSYEDSFLVRFGLTTAEIFPIGLIIALANAFYYSVLARKTEKSHL